MAESLAQHGTPDLRPEDLRSFAAADTAPPIDFPAVRRAYHEDGTGRWYAIHFWGYSLLTVPVKWLLQALGADGLRGGQVTNALLFLFLLRQVLYGGLFPIGTALRLGLLALFSPAVWFVAWTHPESACFVATLLALLWARQGRHIPAVLAASLGAMQNPGLLWLAAAAWSIAVSRRPVRPARVALATAALLPAVVSPLFYLAQFGVPSLLARDAAAVEHLSWRRAAELLFDLNLGLLPYAPLVVLLFLVALAVSSSQRLWAARSWGAVSVAVLAALTCTVTRTWNHGTAGPSRYGVWLAAFLLYVIAEADAWIAAQPHPWVRRWWRGSVAAAVAVQILVVVLRGGLAQAPDSERHSYAARLVLRHAPAWYAPTPEIFTTRTLGRWVEGDEPAAYRDADGRCRKAWMRPRDADFVAAACGHLPPAADRFVAQTGPARRRDWRYIDYD
jgi:hypothetical protein